MLHCSSSRVIISPIVDRMMLAQDYGSEARFFCGQKRRLVVRLSLTTELPEALASGVDIAPAVLATLHWLNAAIK